MMLAKRDVRELMQNAQAAVLAVQASSPAVQAWDKLREQESCPYTEAALVAFEAAYSRDPDNLNLTHHLAIAHHARAWDLELAGDARAAGEWEMALGYWRALAAAPKFWDDLKTKWQTCDPEAKVEQLAEVRQNLLENLLDIHVDFVRHYCEGEKPERALSHVEIVKRAHLPPAVKKQLVQKVFEAMTSIVPETRAKAEYASALTSVERFLALFPDNLAALRLQVEIGAAWVAKLSYKEQWDEIERLSLRLEGHARALAAHPEISQDSLAQTALETLAYEFALRGSDRGDHFEAEGKSQPDILAVSHEAARSAYEFGIRWGLLGAPHSPGESQLRKILVLCLRDHAYSFYTEALDMVKAEIDPRTKLRAIERLFGLALADMEEALKYLPNNERLLKERQTLVNELAVLAEEKEQLRQRGYQV